MSARQTNCANAPTIRQNRQTATERELNIVKGLARGNWTKLLARDRNISTKTLNQHISTIYRKLQVADWVQLALFAIQHDLT